MQTCIIHLIRNTFRLAGRQHWDALKRDVKPIYTAVNAEAARAALDELTEKWGTKYVVGLFRLFGDRAFLVAGGLVVVGVSGSAVRSAPWGCASGELEFAALVRDQTGPGEGIVLTVGDQMPGQRGHLPGRGHNSDLEPAAGAYALIERPQRPGRSHRRPCGLH